ncbi:condensation protein [Paraburkholderia bannensis]|uniref:HxxPF-repeated domain-containing protein n=1 Tax=Paraburkholderia tropica TaxID=92647 RepID=A0AAQ1JSI8_9BURK|nr:condensation protein [Paraburkholderia bannensis]RQN35351.1 condensation protein [Paraburkholderia tropica]SEJ10142.1 HxxPF-repeated domain-containing protein [Paraburkholderia tropica]
MNGIALKIAPTEAADSVAALDSGYALFPATACQTRFWHEQKAAPHASALNIAFRLQLSGPLNAASLEQVLADLVARHEILRTGFLMTGAGLRQQVWSDAPFRLDVIDLSGLDDQAALAEAQRVGGEQARTPFDLASRSYFRAVWLPRSSTQGELQLTFHSLVMDGWSFAIVVRELVEGLAALHAGKDAAYADVDLHHGDYALWKEEFLASGALDRARAHWRNELRDFSRFDVPGDRARGQERRFQGAIRSILLPLELSEHLIAAAKAQGVTLFSVAAASLAVALQKATGSSNTARVAIGTQMSVRDQQELEGVIGPLINTVILRLDVAPDSSLASVIAQCGAKLSDAIEHLHVPFEEMREMAGEAASTDRPPLCSVNFALQQSFVGMGDEVRRDAFAATTSPSFNAGALYDLNFFMVRRPEGWRISCEGDLDLYDVATIDAHLATWRDVLQKVEITAPVAAQKAAPVHSQVQAQTQTQIAAGVGNSAFISQAEMDAKVQSVVRFNEDGTQTPIIVLNNVAVFYELAQQVGAQRAIVDMPMVPKTPQHFPPRAFEDIAADAVRLIKRIQPEGPYILMGYCVLGAMALEAAHQMRREGDTVELVILNDSWRPGYRESMPWYDKILRKIQVRSDDIPRDFRATRRGEMSMIHFLQQFRTVRWFRLIQIGLKLGLLKQDPGGNVVDENLWYGRNIGYLREQQARYRPAPYDGNVQIFRSAQVLKGRLFANDMGWGDVVTGKLVVTEVPGMHNQMFRAAGSAVMGEQLRTRLAGIETQGVRSDVSSSAANSADDRDAPAPFTRPAHA